MKPSIAEFQEKFGLDCLGSAGFRCLDIIKAHTEAHEKITTDCTLSKTPRRKEFELCDFDNLEEACRHFFDTSTLAAAILDCVGIPRLLILNGDEKTMWQSGWKFKGRCTLGDTSLQTGRRVALAIDSRLCSHHGAQNFWGECRSTPYCKEENGNVLPPAEIFDVTHLNDLRFKVGEKVQAYVGPENDDALVREMIVDMSGIPEINGIYNHDGYHDRVSKYTKRCFYNGKYEDFCLFRCKLADSTRRWYISIVPMNSHPGTTKGIDFYAAKPSSEDDSLPPRHNWMCIPNFKCHGVTLKRKQSPSPEVYPKTYYESDKDSIIGEFVDGVVLMQWDDGNAYRVELEDDKRSHVWAPEDKDMYIRARRMLLDEDTDEEII